MRSLSIVQMGLPRNGPILMFAMPMPVAGLDSLSQPRKTPSPHARVNATETYLLTAYLSAIRQTLLQLPLETLNTPLLDHQLA